MAKLLRNLLFVLLLTALPGAAKAQSEAIFRSVVFPGWGQFYNRQPIKGLIFIGGEAALLGSALYFSHQARDKYDAYALATDPAQTAGLYDDARKDRNLEHWSLALMGGVWIFNVVDAWLRYDPARHPEAGRDQIGLRLDEDRLSVSLRLHLNLSGGH